MSLGLVSVRGAPRVRLADLGTWTGGGTPSKSRPEYWSGSIPWVSPKDMKVRRIRYSQDHISPKAVRESSTKVVPSGSILMVTRSGILAHTLPLAVTDVPVALNQDLKALTPTSDLDPTYVYWALTALEREILDNCSKDGTTVASIDTARLMRVEISVPPLNQQLRVVAAIDEQQSRLDAGLASLKAARQKLASYRRSLLHAACRGQLTSSDARDHSVDAVLEHAGVRPPTAVALPTGWRMLRLGDVAAVGSGATPLRSRLDYYKGGTIPWVTSAQLNDEYVRKPTELITTKALHECSVTVWPVGTLLVAMYGEGRTRGKCSELMIPACTNQACAAIVFRDELVDIRPFVKLFLMASYEANRSLASGGVQPNLSLGLIRGLQVPMPPARERTWIVSEVQRRLSIVAALEASLQSALHRSESLRKQMLAAVFTSGLAQGSGTMQTRALTMKAPRPIAALATE